MLWNLHLWFFFPQDKISFSKEGGMIMMFWEAPATFPSAQLPLTLQSTLCTGEEHVLKEMKKKQRLSVQIRRWYTQQNKEKVSKRCSRLTDVSGGWGGGGAVGISALVIENFMQQERERERDIWYLEVEPSKPEKQNERQHSDETYCYHQTADRLKWASWNQWEYDGAK